MAAMCGSSIAGRTANADRHSQTAAELVALAPDVILANGTSAMGPLQQATRSLPIVFANVSDPVGSRVHCQPGATGRQCHRLQCARIQFRRQIAGDAEADFARR